MRHVQKFVAFFVVGLMAPGWAQAQGAPTPVTAPTEAAEAAPEAAPATAPEPAAATIDASAPAPMPAAGAVASAPASKIWIGGHLGLSPVGSVKVDVGDITISGDTAFGYGFGGVFEYFVTPNISIGAAPALLLNVKGEDAMDSATGLDLPLRIAAGAEVTPEVRLYGFAAPGYSIVFPPSDADDPNASGFLFGFGGGAGYKVAPKVMLTGELGYQFRFLSVTEQGESLDLQTNYLTLAVGIRAALD